MYSLFRALAEVQHGVLQQRVLAVVDDRSGLVDTLFLDPGIVIGLSPFLGRAQSLVLQVFLMVRLVDGRHVVRHATDRYVILMLGNYVIGMAVRLDVIHVIRLRLDRLCDLRYVTLVMVYLLERLLIDLRARQDHFPSCIENYLGMLTRPRSFLSQRIVLKIILTHRVETLATSP